jgi:hypothetical protein
MPLSVNSRYAGLPIYEANDANQVSHATVAIRAPVPLPPGSASVRHLTVGVDTFEYIAWRYLGSSDAWWRICEANALVFPLDLPPATAVNVPAAGDVGRITRTRSF